MDILSTDDLQLMLKIVDHSLYTMEKTRRSRLPQRVINKIVARVKLKLKLEYLLAPKIPDRRTAMSQLGSSIEFFTK